MISHPTTIPSERDGPTSTSTAGVGALVVSTPVALTSLTVVGAIYLIWLGSVLVLLPMCSCLNILTTNE